MPSAAVACPHRPVRPQPRVLVCDDDAGVRSVVTEMIEERGGRVIAETDRSTDAITLIERFEPDAVVLDLGLAQGSGKEVIDHLGSLERPPRVIVFTSFDGAWIGAPAPFVQVVLKPDFELLGRRLASVTSDAGGGDRRKPIRTTAAPAARQPSGADQADEFYRTLADARAEDTVMSVSLVGLDATAAVQAVRETIRVQDRLVMRGDALTVLLISGEAAAPDALSRRLADTIPDIDERTSSRSCGDDPVAAFLEIQTAATTLLRA